MTAVRTVTRIHDQDDVTYVSTPGGVLFQDPSTGFFTASPHNLKYIAPIEANWGASFMMGYSGNVMAATAELSQILGGGRSSFEQRILDTLGSHAQYMTICGGYDNTVNASWPGGIFGSAHTVLNYQSKAVGYDWAYGNVNTNHVYTLGGTYNTVQGVQYGGIVGGTANIITDKFNGVAQSGSIVLGGSFNVAGSSFSHVSGAINAVFGNFGTAVGGENNIVAGGFALAAGGQNNLLTGGTSSVIIAGQENIVSGNRAPYAYIVTLGTEGSGTFSLSVNNTVTSALAYNCAASDIKTALEALASIGAGNTTVTGSVGGPFTIVFASSLTMSTFLSVQAGLLGGRTTVFATPGQRWALSLGGATGGTFTVSYGRDLTNTSYKPWNYSADLAYNISAADLQTALVAFTSIGAGNATVTYDTPNTRFLIDIAPSVAIYTLVANGSNLTGGTGVTYDTGGSPDVNHIAGRQNHIFGSYDTIGGGRNNQIDGSTYATIGGGASNIITTAGGFATIGGGTSNYIGLQTTDASESVIAGGSANEIDAKYGNIAGGKNNTITSAGVNATICGGSTNTASNTQATIGGGTNNLASGQISVVGGGTGNTASGQYATCLGGTGNLSSGVYSSVLGGSTNTASGQGSGAGGHGHTVSGDYAFAWGDTNAIGASSAGNYSAAFGFQNTITNRFAFVCGRGNTGGGENITVIGKEANSSRWAAFVQGAGKFVTAGDAQTSVLLSRAATADATPTTLFLDGSSLSCALPNNTVWHFTITTVFRRTDSVATANNGAYTATGVISRAASAGSTALLAAVTPTLFIGSGGSSALAITANTSSGALQISFTGEVAKTYHVVSRIVLVEVG